MNNPEKWTGSVTHKDLLTGNEKTVSVETGSEQIFVVGCRDGQKQCVAVGVADVPVLQKLISAATEEVIAARTRPDLRRRPKID
jgi:hypothetical protein